MRAAQRHTGQLGILFPKEEMTVPDLKLSPDLAVDDTILGLRINEIETETFTNMCDNTEEYIRPRAAKNKAGHFRFIVNSPSGGGEQYVQLVRVTRCMGAGEECGYGQIGEHVRSRCHQEYTDHKLVALSDNGDQLVIDTFRFPSCCTCHMLDPFRT